MSRTRAGSPFTLVLLTLAAFAVTTPWRTPLGAQSPPPDQKDGKQAKEDAAPAQPPEVAALNDALKIADTAKRFPALQKVIDDYPGSEAAGVARSQLVTQIGANLAADKNALQAYLAKDLPASKNVQDYSQIATSLLRAELFLDEAEAAARSGLAIDEQTYTAAMKQAGASDRTPLVRTVKEGVPYYTAGAVLEGRGGHGARGVADEDLHERFKTTRQTLMTTLGAIYAKRGKDAEAEKTLREVWAMDVPLGVRANLAGTLADLAGKAGRVQDELDYRAVAYVGGRASASARQALEKVYSKAHGGSLDGLDTLLDESYRRWTCRLEVKPYARPARTTGRMVLAELFTGAACPPCVGADMAFDAAVERFSRTDLAFLVYHQHIPGPDPMTNPSTEARKSIYAVGGVPTFAIDGKGKVGGGSADAAERIFNEDVSSPIESALGSQPEARIELKTFVRGSAIEVKARVRGVKSKSAKLRLQIALAEELQRYSGPNGVRFHPMVVRSLAGADFRGFPVTANGADVEHVFDVARIVAQNRKATDEFLEKPFRGGDKPTFIDGRRDDIDTGRLIVVAFVQDEDPGQVPPSKRASATEPAPGDKPFPVRHVLQTAMVKVPALAKKTTD